MPGGGREASLLRHGEEDRQLIQRQAGNGRLHTHSIAISDHQSVLCPVFGTNRTPMPCRNMIRDEERMTQRSKAATVALWVLRVLIAAAFLAAGFMKLSGQPMMVAEFDHVGLGQWFRCFTGLMELVGGLAVLIPAVSAYGAMVCWWSTSAPSWRWWPCCTWTGSMPSSSA